MNRKEREQFAVFEKLQAQEILQANAAQMLKVSTRWIREKFKRFLAFGAQGLTHRSRGKPSPKKFNKRDRALIVTLLKTDWIGFGPTFAAETLYERYKVKVSAETLRKIMIREGLWCPGKKKRSYRAMRERRALLGSLVQLDGSPHKWFENRAPECTLLVFIDDATSKILWLEFAKSESYVGVATATKNFLKAQGRPLSFYVDYGSVFSVNYNNAERTKLTQFERGLKELSIDLIHARSPQAKGRVERANQTLQDRLIKQLRLDGISSIQDGNEYLRQGLFINNHNKKYAVPAAQGGNLHRSIEGYNLENILCQKEERILTNDFTISYKARILQLENHQKVVIRPKHTINVHEYLDGKVSLYVRGQRLRYHELGTKMKGKLHPVDYVNNAQDITPLASYQKA